MNEHNVSLISQVNPLIDEINSLENRFKILNIKKTMGDNRQQLEKWRDKCHEKIDCFFEEKCQEHNRLVNQKVDEQRKEIRRIQSKINEIINIQEITRQDIDSLASTIRQLEKNMSNIEQACFKVQSHPLAIDDNIIIIKELTEHEIDLSTLSPAYKQMPRPKESF
ncbi:unnamed protein product [Rotaria socialis]|nr:unnamed protein product [Rotaria socialis]CAF4388186.1 unnamed protein product [Rotaria socialis]CAF4941881.1 unnamed protein product [Rotaria socialis]